MRGVDGPAAANSSPCCASGSKLYKDGQCETCWWNELHDMKDDMQVPAFLRSPAKAGSPTHRDYNYVPGWVALMDIAPVGRNFVGESAQFFLPVTLRTLGSGFVGFETPRTSGCNSDSSTSNHCAGPPVQGNPRKSTCEGIHHVE